MGNTTCSADSFFGYSSEYDKIDKRGGKQKNCGYICGGSSCGVSSVKNAESIIKPGIALNSGCLDSDNVYTTKIRTETTIKRKNKLEEHEVEYKYSCIELLIS